MLQNKIHLDKMELAYRHILNSNEPRLLNQVVSCILLHLKSKNKSTNEWFKCVHYHLIEEGGKDHRELHVDIQLPCFVEFCGYSTDV